MPRPFPRAGWTVVALAMALASWVSAAAAGPDAAMGEAAGAALFNQHCAGCHAPGPGHPATMLLSELGREHPALVENPDLDADYIRSVVRAGLIEMPPFRMTEVPDAELDAIIAHIEAGRRAP